LPRFAARRQIDGVFCYLRYRSNGSQRIKSIGRHGSPWTPDTARSAAKTKLGIAAAGVDPFAAEAKARTAETFGKEIERYLRRKKTTMKPRAFKEIERHLMHHAQPLQRARLGEIDRRAIAVQLAEVEEASGPVARNRVRSSLSAFFGWPITEGFIELNPVVGTAKVEEGGSRERVLTHTELAEVWAALEDDQFGDIVQLLILTAQRREEIGSLRCSEIDFDRGLIVFPPDRTKNKRLHELALSAQARAILERQPRRKNSDRSPRDFIFGYGAGGFSGWSDIIIDTKYYREALVENKYGDKKVRSDHLYQLFSYLKNIKSQPGNECLAEGILLYPAVSQSLDLKFIIGGHQVRVRTIRLDRPWQQIHAELCSLLSIPHRPQLEPMAA
jgi:integrase